MSEPKSALRRNWIKAGLGLLYCKEGIQDFVYGVMDNFQRQTYTHIGGRCNTCTTQNVLTCPTFGICAARRCHFHDNTDPGKISRPCPSNICEQVRDEIIQEHRSGKPSFKNTKAEYWSSNAWEMAKCYMAPTGYLDIQTADDTDFTGLISVILNFMPFQNHVNENLGVPGNLFEQGRECRNKILHNAMMEVSTADVPNHLLILKHILTDQRTIQHLPNAQTALRKINDLENNKVVITEEDESKLREESKKALLELTDKCREEIQRTTADSVNILDNTQSAHINVLQDTTTSGTRSLKETRDQGKKELRETIENGSNILKREHEDHLQVMKDKSDLNITALNENSEQSLRDIKEEVENGTNKIRRLQERIEENTKQILETTRKSTKQIEDLVDTATDSLDKKIEEGVNKLQTAVETSTKEVHVIYARQEANIDYLQRLEDLQKEVIQHYQTNGYCKSAIPVLIDDEEIDIQEFYVKPTLKVKQDKNSDPDYYGSTVSSIHELFPHETIRRVCIQGEAGYGKTSFCKHLISSWCKVHSGNNTEKLCEKDKAFLKSLDLLFYIPLRNYEIADVNEMIKQEIIRKGLHNSLTTVIEQESEKCLIILDGLDECSSGLPQIDIRENYKVIFTSRPWKIESLRTKPHLLGRVIQLAKMKENDDLIKAVVKSLNKKEGKQLDWTKFKYDEYKENVRYNRETSQYMKIRHLAEIPVILIQMVCMWFDGEELGNTRSEIYTSMLQYLFRVAEKYRPEAVQKYLSKQNIEALKRESFKDLKMINDLFSGLIFKLAELAFHSLVRNTESEVLVFSHSDMRIFDLSKEDIEFCLDFGILSQEKLQRNCTKQEKMLSFLHKTFQEYFSAIHVTFSHESVLSETLGTSVEDVHRNSEIMSFVVGISFSHVNQISSHIARLVDNDKRVLKYRTLTEIPIIISDVTRVQELLCILISEGHVDNTGENPLIELRDVVIDDDTYKRVQNTTLSLYLNTDSVKSFVCKKKCQLRETHVLRIANRVKDLVKLAAEIEVQEDVDIITGIINRSRAYLKCVAVIKSWPLFMNRHPPIRLGTFYDALVKVDMLSIFTFDSVSMDHEDLKLFGQCLVHLKHLEELCLHEIKCATCSYKQCTCRIELLFNEQIRRLKISNTDGHILLGSHPSLESVTLKDVKIIKLDFSSYKQLQDLKLFFIKCTTCTSGKCCCTVDLHCNEQLKNINLFLLKGHILLGSHPRLESVELRSIKITRIDFSIYKQLRVVTLESIICRICPRGECCCTVDLRYNEQLKQLTLFLIDGHFLLGSHPFLGSVEIRNIKVTRLDFSSYKQLRDLTLRNIICRTCTCGKCCCTIDLRYNEQLKILDLQGPAGQIVLDPLHSLVNVKMDYSKELVHVLHQLKNSSCLGDLELSGNKVHRRDGDQFVNPKGVIAEVLPTLHSLQSLVLNDIDLDDDDLIIPREMIHLKRVILGDWQDPVTMTLQCVKRFVDSILQVQHTITVYMNEVYIRPAQDTREAEQYIRDNCHVIFGGIEGLNDGDDEDGEHDKNDIRILMIFENHDEDCAWWDG